MEKEKHSGIRYKMKAESRVERGVVQESRKVLMAQEQLGMEVMEMEEAFS